MILHSKKQILFILFLLVCISSCYYKPFISYKLNSNGFKEFSKQEKLAGDTTHPFRNYHINTYDWNVSVFPEKKSISGTMSIGFTPKTAQDTFLFDLQRKMKITSYKTNKGKPSIERKGDLLYIIFQDNMSANSPIALEIGYQGKPANVGDQGPIQWKKDQKGRPWISTATEGIGPHFIMPCSALLQHEADSTNIEITVPHMLTVVSNGRLQNSTTNFKEDTKTFQYQVNNPINIYNISFNIGHFITLTKPYVDTQKKQQELTFEVLDYNAKKAGNFYQQTPSILKELEQLYGVFPWWNDGCKFVESTFAAMEHQSAIAMGSDYTLDWKNHNQTLIHELAHEWWGNNVTAYDYCDIWIHEGMATYSEALVIEKLYGKADYEKRIKKSVNHTLNKIPIRKTCNVLYNSWVNPSDFDIYSKGSLLMHSLRTVVQNDALFFDALKTIQQDYAKSNITSEAFISKMNTLLKQDYSSLFDWYLNRIKPPVLLIKIDVKTQELFYKWKEAVTFYKKGAVIIDIDGNNKEIRPTTTYQLLALKNGNSLDFLVEKSIYYIVEEE